MAGLKRAQTPASRTLGPGVPTMHEPYNPGMTPDPTTPVTGYVTTRSPLAGVDPPTHATVRTRAPVVSRAPNRAGESHTYGRGAYDMYGSPMAVAVRSSLFQPDQMGPIVNVAGNAHLYRCGVPTGIGLPGRGNPGLSFRAAAIATSRFGGPTASRMGAKPAFSRVQTIPRYATQPARYNTRSAGGK